MNSPLIQLLVLAGIAVFLILRLRSVLGTREGFEKPHVVEASTARRPNLEVIEGGPDRDIVDHVPEHSPAAFAFAAMKKADPDFNVGGFLQGARGAYEMILMAFERGDLSQVKPFIAPEVYDAFSGVIAQREADGLTVEATFIGVSELGVQAAEFDPASKEAEITLRMTAEFTYVVRDRGGDIVEGSPSQPRRQRDVWTFARSMTSGDPNWMLVETGE